MRDYICVKCNSIKVVKVVEKSMYNNALSLNAFKNVLSTKYVCCDCGYYEEYYDNEDDRKLIYEKYKKQS
ncbi:MAG: hypothetical protein ACRDAU_08870 [Clostridium sp.]